MHGMRSILTAIIFLISIHHTAVTQERPLLESLRVGYSRTDSIGDRLRLSTSLAQSMRRKGFIIERREFPDGLQVLHALHADAIDIALDVGLSDMVIGKIEHLKMVMIAELRSIAPTCCDLQEIYADEILKRFT